jgi:hypothetical protein
MQISPGPVRQPELSSIENGFAGHKLIKAVVKASKEYETCYQRVERVRNKLFRTADGSKLLPHRYDQILAHPERFKSKTVRALIQLSQYLEELGESVADLSGLTERIARNTISSGEKNDLAKVMSSALGRIASSQLNMFGFALHKAIGSSAYFLSALLSAGVLAYVGTGRAALRTPQELQRIKFGKTHHQSLYLAVARKALQIKERHIHKILSSTNGRNETSIRIVRKLAKSISRKHSSFPAHMVSQRRAHSNYILNNLHQYGALTRGLMQFSYLTFQGVNKLLVSYDKHLGTAFGKHVLAKSNGDVFGCRLALTASTAAATAISIPAAPLIVGISTIGAIACGFALTALLLAKANVYYLSDWEGDILPTNHQVFGRVTPTCP